MTEPPTRPKFEPNTDAFTGGTDFVAEGRMRPSSNAATSMLATCDRLLGENDEGCVEYKWRLTGIAPQRLEHLMTQMKFRVAEGKGQCMYELGVADDGEPRGLLPEEYSESVATVEKMARRLGFHARVTCERVVSRDPLKQCCEILVTRGAKATADDLSIAMCGSVDAGKSTFIGVLAGGVLDDGAGSARQTLFNHKHELDTGRTSSLSQRVLGFDEMGRVTNYEAESDANGAGVSSSNGGIGIGGGSGGCGSPGLSHAQNTTQTIADRSVRLVNLVDLAGDARYAKTTIFGMTSRSPGYACIVIGANQQPDAVAQYFHLCHALRIPHFVVVTKCDLVAQGVAAASAHIAALLNGVSKQVSAVKISQDSACDFQIATSADEAVAALTAVAAASTATTGLDEPRRHTVPVFPVSCVTGEGIALMRAFLHQLPPQTPPVSEPAEVLLNGGSFSIPDVGTVITGIVTKGTIAVGARLMIGPGKFGAFSEIAVKSIHVSGQHVQSIAAGSEGAFAISHVPAHFDVSRKGGVLVAKGTATLVCREFDAEVTVLTPDVIMPSQEPILHCRNIRQAVKIVSIDGAPYLKRNQSGRMRCRLLYHPEMLDVDAVVVLRSNNTAKIVGRLVSVYPLTPAPSLPCSPDFARAAAVGDEFPHHAGPHGHGALHSGRSSSAEASPDTRSSAETTPTTREPRGTTSPAPQLPPSAVAAFDAAQGSGGAPPAMAPLPSSAVR